MAGILRHLDRLLLGGLLLVAVVILVGYRAGARPEGPEPIAMEVQQLPPQPTLAVRLQVPAAQAEEELARAVPRILGYLRAYQVQATGEPFARHRELPGGLLELEVGVPIAEPVERIESTHRGVSGQVHLGRLPGGRVATTWHVGPYRDLAATRQALAEWARRAGHRPATPSVAWESFSATPQPEEVRARLYLPLRE
jgi:effector-binding domain-containing protein